MIIFYLISKISGRGTAITPQLRFNRIMPAPHVPPNDPAFVAYIQATGLYIRLLFQSSNRNDISLLDIGFFKSLQCLQHTRYPSNIDKQITVFQESFQQVQSNKLNNNFLTLQKVMELCITGKSIMTTSCHISTRQILIGGVSSLCQLSALNNY